MWSLHLSRPADANAYIKTTAVAANDNTEDTAAVGTLKGDGSGNFQAYGKHSSHCWYVSGASPSQGCDPKAEALSTHAESAEVHSFVMSVDAKGIPKWMAVVVSPSSKEVKVRSSAMVETSMWGPKH